MRNLWAVARQTFIQSLRSRIITIFIILIACWIFYIGMTVEGDGTLKGKIQTFLAYSTSLTQLFLSLATIFLMATIITRDIRYKHIFTIVTKPIARWQYIAGRWLGVIFLNAVLLFPTMGVIYLVAEYLRQQPTAYERKMTSVGQMPLYLPDPDRAAVENEIFSARAVFQPDPFDIKDILQQRWKKLIEEKGLDNLIIQYIKKKLQKEKGKDAPIDETKIEKQLRDPSIREKIIKEIKNDLRKQILGEIELIKPGLSLCLTFSGLKPNESDRKLEFRYKLHPFHAYRRTLVSTWHVKNPKTGYYEIIPRTDSPDTTSSFMISPKAVSDDGKTVICFINVSMGKKKTTIQLKPDEVKLYQCVGSFEGNVFRAGLVILSRLTFLAATGILFGVFLSFPITCLACLMVFSLGMMSAFLFDATRIVPAASPGAFDYFSHYLVKGIFIFIPTFSGTSAVDALVDGVYISWSDLLKEYAIIITPSGSNNGLWSGLGFKIETGTGFRAILSLIIGWLIFRRRELG